jgi:hypothetical protein
VVNRARSADNLGLLGVRLTRLPISQIDKPLVVFDLVLVGAVVGIRNPVFLFRGSAHFRRRSIVVD